MDLCPCDSKNSYSECCKPVISGQRRAATAEELMRSRYSAYVKKEIAYIGASLHPDQRSTFDENQTRGWAEKAEWNGLEIVKTKGGGPDDIEGQVEFIARFTEEGGKKEHHELSTFRKQNGVWYLADGKIMGPKPVVRTDPKTGRNDPCSCGSGKKFKKCCGK